MRIRNRLLLLLSLFGAAVLINILALFFLARSVFSSLDIIERVRVRQLIAVEMAEKLRNAEAALYRYQIEGERGFAMQFQDQIQGFGESVKSYQTLEEEKSFSPKLLQTQQDVKTVGEDLIRLHDSQTGDVQAMIRAQTQLANLLVAQIKTKRPNDGEYQTAADGMNESARGMLLTVTAYLTAPDEATRGQFTDAAVQFQKHFNKFKELAVTTEEQNWVTQITALGLRLQNLGSQLISGRDQQQALFARFSAANFEASQRVIVGQIQPLEAQKLSEAQDSLSAAVSAATAISLLVPLVITFFAGVIVFRLARNMDQNVLALLRGADRVASGDLQQPVRVESNDELQRLARAFNNMMADLEVREQRLRALMQKMSQIQDEERRLVGLDLHDGLTQLVISANMHLNTLSAMTTHDLDAAARQEMEASRRLIKRAIEEARRVIVMLRPTVVEDFGIAEGLQRYAAEVCETEGWKLETHITLNSVALNHLAETAIFRIAQEALANASKHSRTKAIKIDLECDGDELMLSVEDWGKGFNVGRLTNEMDNLGLISMRERARILGGVCRITSEVGQGTKVEVRIPLAGISQRVENSNGR